MKQYNMLEAKDIFSKTCKMVSNKEEDCVIIASNGKPLVKMIPYDEKRKIGIHNGKYIIDEKNWKELDEEISEMFEKN